MLRNLAIRWFALLLRWGTAAALLLAIVPAARAQGTSGGDVGEPPQPPVAMFPHPDNTWWWISGQANVVFQAHPSFPAFYSGPNSLPAYGEHATSEVFTLYTGAKLGSSTEVLLDLESAGGHGIGEALGLAGFTNLDVVRNPSMGRAPYLARLEFHHVFALSRATEENDADPSRDLFSQLPARRFEVRFGKMSVVDFFDANSGGSDSHLQFLNWTVDNNGAYDYAADTRGYTVGALLEYHVRRWSARFGEFLMPKVANGPDLDWDLRRARAENAEFELRHSFLRGRHGALRVLGFVNHANMGSYRAAIQRYLAGVDARPDVTLTRRPGTVKYGFGLNGEQELTGNLRVFGRLGWNEGQHESFAYTEVDQTAEFGGDIAGSRWRRPVDRIGAAVVSNGISRLHQEYLRLGGLGFLLGDGGLNYAREDIVEAYYDAHLWRGFFAAFDLQHVTHPGYNRDRGPVTVPGLRLHVDF